MICILLKTFPSLKSLETLQLWSNCLIRFEMDWSVSSRGTKIHCIYFMLDLCFSLWFFFLFFSGLHSDLWRPVYTCTVELKTQSACVTLTPKECKPQTSSCSQQAQLWTQAKSHSIYLGGSWKPPKTMTTQHLLVNWPTVWLLVGWEKDSVTSVWTLLPSQLLPCSTDKFS